MKRYKGCINPECDAFKEQTKYKEENLYCPNCGCKLEYVCKDCHKALEDDSDAFCKHCLAKRHDRFQKVKDIGVAVGTTLLAVAGTAAAMLSASDTEDTPKGEK